MSMPMSELIEAINRIRDDLSEARRYVRTPEMQGDSRRINAIIDALDDLDLADIETRVACRLGINLEVGDKAIRVSPAVLEGYIEGALYELAALKGRLERGAAELANQRKDGE